MAPPLERRQFNRIMVSLPVDFHTRLPIPTPLLRVEGVLRDISLSGTYFMWIPSSFSNRARSSPLPFSPLCPIWKTPASPTFRLPAR